MSDIGTDINSFQRQAQQAAHHACSEFRIGLVEGAPAPTTPEHPVTAVILFDSDRMEASLVIALRRKPEVPDAPDPT